MKSIAIIGAGLSGLIAAQELTKQGWQVSLFDKARGRSGRLSSKRLSWGQADMGAQYFTARDPGFIHHCQQWLQHEVIKQWRFTPHQYQGDVLSLSADDETRYVGSPDMSALCRYLSMDMKLQLSTRICHLQQRPKGWMLWDEAENKYGLFDWVLVTAPAEQAHALLEPHSALLSAEIQQPVHQPCWTLVLQTHSKVPSEVQGVFCQQHPLRWLARDSAKPGRSEENGHIFVLQYNPEYSQQQIQTPRDTLIESGFQHLQQVLGCHIQPGDAYCHFWRYASPKPEWNGLTQNVDPANKLAMAGDWIYSGRVENAFLSGLHTSRVITE